MAVAGIMHSIGERFVVSQNKELTAFRVVAKVANGKVHSEELTTKGAILSFCWLEEFGEETKWLPNIVDFLV